LDINCTDAEVFFTQEMEVMTQRGRPRKEWREKVERDLQVLGVRRWRELVTGTHGEVSFNRPKCTVGSSANGKEEEDAEVNQGWPRCEGPWNISDSMSVQPSVCQTQRKEY
jgi:hypothetical protein